MDAHKFEVASVKTADPNASPGGLEYRERTGEFHAARESLERLIAFAWDVRLHQIAQGPKWRGSALFDVDAKGGPVPVGPPGIQLFRLMVRALLAERFGLAVHLETREEPIFELVVDKGGSKLKESAAKNGSIRMAPGQLTGFACPLLLLVNQLSRQLEHNVVDKTGLTGRYDFVVKYQPDPSAATESNADAASTVPSLFTALREELGLKLQPAKGPVEIAVIDRAELPSAN